MRLGRKKCITLEEIKMRLERKKCITLDDAFKMYRNFKSTYNFGEYIDYLKLNNWRIL